MAVRDRLRRGPIRPPASSDEMPEEHRKLLQRIVNRWEHDMEPVHRQYRERWDYVNGLYHNFDQLRSKWQEADRDQDRSAQGVLLDARRDWGGHLVIPHAFAITETVVPRVVAKRPRLLVKALQEWADEKAGPIQDAINQQLSDIDLQLKLVPLARRAVKLGLGVQFVYWEEQSREVMRWAPRGDGERVPVPTMVADRKGPQVEDIDIYNFFWDPTAKSIETCEDILYRTWRPFSYIEKKVKEGRELREQGKVGGWLDVDLDTVKNMGRSAERNELWQGRLEAQGLSTGSELREGHVHEVWQYFKGDRVTTVLNRQFVVQDDVTPFFHREFPFQAYRPIPIEDQLPGLGVIDSIQHLIAELSTMRTQRRDAATIALNPPTFYSKGTLQRQHMKSGPGVWIPVNGDVREAVWQPQLRDIPASGYAEEDRLVQNIEMTSGISDPVAGGSGTGGSAGTETATGIQLIQAAANVRITLMAHMLLLETLRPFGRQVLELNRQHQLEPLEMRVEDQESPEGYRYLTIEPEDWQAPLEVVPEEGSNEPENRPQRINDANQLYQQLQGNELVNKRELLKHVLTEWGIRNPDSWLASEVQLNPEMAEVVGQAFQQTLLATGAMNEEQANQVTMAALKQAMQQTGVSPGQNGAEGG